MKSLTKGTPTLDALYKVYKGVCQITFRKIKKSEAMIEHVLPRSMGGDGWNNVVLISKNARKLIDAHNSAVDKAMSGKTSILFQAFGLRKVKPPGLPLPAPKSVKRIRQPDRTWSSKRRTKVIKWENLEKELWKQSYANTDSMAGWRHDDLD